MTTTPQAPKHLKYCMLTAGITCKENRHPQTVMRELGITYQHATPQSIADMWQFWNCENLPDPLPQFLTVCGWNPMESARTAGRGSDGRI